MADKDVYTPPKNIVATPNENLLGINNFPGNADGSIGAGLTGAPRPGDIVTKDGKLERLAVENTRPENFRAPSNFIAPEETTSGLSSQLVQRFPGNLDGSVGTYDGTAKKELENSLGRFGFDTAKTFIKGGDDVKSLETRAPVFRENLDAVQINVSTNELNRFSSYTYNISLYMLDSRQYVDLTTRPYSPQDVINRSLLLMRSGGSLRSGAESQLERDLGFSNNFFIDDLEITNVAVGPSRFKQNTNATDIRFTIMEPRGVTLLERLRNAAATTLSATGERYIHAPYLLEITFKGYDNEGQPIPTPSTPKYIPIRITDISFDVSESGTQYKVEAVPFAHHIFGQINSTIPINVEVKASKLGNIFSDGVQSYEIEQERSYDEFGDPVTNEKKVLGEKALNLGEILTNHQIERTKIKRPEVDTNQGGYDAVPGKPIPPDAELYDTYSFVIADEIANAKLYTEELFDALSTPQAKGEGKQQDKANTSQFQSYVAGLAGSISLDKDTQLFRINAGTDLTKLINLLIMHSDYMDQNVLDDIKGDIEPQGQLKWFKIKPVIKRADGPGKGFDSKDGRYKYEIQYTVTPSRIYYHDFPWAKRSEPAGEGIHKRYDYLFSGNNTDVLDFKLQFRTAFMQVMTAGAGSLSNKNAQSDFVPQVIEQPFSVEGNSINNRDSVQRTRAKDLFSSVMSDGVDMVDLDMQIVGDPAYIPTSDAFWQDKIRSGQLYTEAYMPDGTINYDFSPPYIQVNLRTPVDYDEQSGLAEPSRIGNSSFSGIYRVTSVDSVFSGGAFQQRLYGFRNNIQPNRNGIGRDTADVAQNLGNERQDFDKNLIGYDEVKPQRRTGSARVLDRSNEQVYYDEVPQQGFEGNPALDESANLPVAIATSKRQDKPVTVPSASAEQADNLEIILQNNPRFP